MRRASCLFAFVAGILLIPSYVFGAQPVSLLEQDAVSNYEQIRTAQPPGLAVTLTLTKDHFYRGEVIPATLTLTNSGKMPWVATWIPNDGTGRNQDIRFFGVDEKSVPVEDPLGWLYEGTVVCRGGQTFEKDLGTTDLTVNANQWLRFDRPGTYTLFATTTVVRGGTREKIQYDVAPELVTNKVTITITPLEPTLEKQIITDATHRIDEAYVRKDSPDLNIYQNDDQAQQRIQAVGPVFESLNYLQTPAARAALRSRLNLAPEFTEGRLQINNALYGAPDRPAEAGLILDDVKAGRLKVDRGLIGLYTQLKSYPQFIQAMDWERRNLTPDEFPKRQAIEKSWNETQKDAGTEILAAAQQASTKTGSSNLDLVWEAFLANPYQPEWRAQAVAHQLDFSHERHLQLLSFLSMSTTIRMTPAETKALSDFLPLIRLYLGSPAYNKDALILLAYAKPTEAHDITLADWASPEHHYFNSSPDMGRLAAYLLDAPGLKWTDEQKDILDRMRNPH